MGPRPFVGASGEDANDPGPAQPLSQAARLLKTPEAMAVPKGDMWTPQCNIRTKHQMPPLKHYYLAVFLNPDKAEVHKNSASTSPLCAILTMRFAISSRITSSDLPSSSVDIALS